MIVFASMMDLRRDAALVLAAHQESGSNPVGALDYLILAEWVVILAAHHTVAWDRVSANWRERAAGLALAIYGLCGVAAESHWATTATCGLIAAKLALQPGARWLGAAIAVVGGQNLLCHIRPLHNAWGRVDAWAAHALLTVAGYPSDYHGSVLGGSTFAIAIAGPCSTSWVVFRVAGAFLIFALCWGASRRSIAQGLAVTLCACWVINVLRLSLMVQSQNDYHYWHAGDGTAIVSVAMMAVAYAAAAGAARSRALMLNSVGRTDAHPRRQ